jgi:hypothetical protein
MAFKQHPDDGGPWLSIGALSKATGIAVETLRTWELRYGFPVPGPARPGVAVVKDLRALDGWARRVSTGAAAGT